MVKLRIVDIDNYKYYLEDEYKNNYTINLEFFDLKEKLKIGNYIYMNKELLNSKYEGYSTSDIDVIKVVLDKTERYLKRLYG